VIVTSPTSEIGRLSAEFNRMSRAIKEREEFLNNIVENIPDMIFVKDAKELRFVRFNKAGEELLGYSREALYGKNSYDLFPEDMADQFIAKDKEVLRTRQPLDIPADIVQTSHRGARILHSKKIPIMDEKGSPQYLLGISEDITDRKRAEDELKRHRDHLEELVRERTMELTIAKEQAESANIAKSEFVSFVAHELKNPLTSLRSAVETLPLARNDTSRARLLEVIEHDVKRLDRLISDISDASRLDAELQRQDMAPVNVRRLLTTLASVANETRLGHDVAVEARFEGRGATDTFSVPGHDSRLGQVISNLLSNAQSFSTPGGKVRVTCRRVRSEIEIVVDDDGPGIGEDALERIFERFYTDRPQESFGQNSGLGLNISRQIVVAHGGRLYAENRPPSGATRGLPDAGGRKSGGARFVIRLPAT
jgi:PAS domain S-box-containing protein